MQVFRGWSELEVGMATAAGHQHKTHLLRASWQLLLGGYGAPLRRKAVPTQAVLP